jgi:glycosyltransferase involved in cell wall biosynthesis
MPDAPPHPLVYVLHSSKLYGTERMALETLFGLRGEFEPILFSPPGPAMDEAEKRGCQVQRFGDKKEFSLSLRRCLAKYPSLTFVATGVVQSAICIFWNLFYRRQIKHFQIVHGGAGERGSYGRKKWLNYASVTFITVSDWARQKLIANGVRPDRIEVIPNFLSEARVAQAPRRPPYERPGVRNVLIVSRMDPLKRVGLLLDALDRCPAELADISFRILGVGPEMQPLAQRAAATHGNVCFAGHSDNVAAELAGADLLIHTCPVESFGLVVLEAMAANLAVLVPAAGGAAALVEEGISGFKFRADDAADLAARLVELKDAPAQIFNQVVLGGRRAVDQTFAAATILERYRRLFADKYK